MSSIISFDSLSCASLDIDIAIEQQINARQLQLKQIEDKTCPLYLNGFCTKQQSCPLRHSKGVDGEVCKHWIRGLCKRGDDCEYLHQYDMSKMPECQFFRERGECAKGDDCPFLHVDASTRITICPWYRRGFCRNGSDCKHQHKPMDLCPRYLAGFCPEGPDCLLAHPKFDLMVIQDLENQQKHQQQQQQQQHQQLQQQQQQHHQHQQQGPRVVTCHKCQETGHYANKCPNSRKR